MGKKLHLHLDADASSKALYNALLERGHDVTRTPAEWMPLDASDEQQLLGATAQGRAIFTYNVRDFIALGEKYPHHSGIILAHQKVCLSKFGVELFHMVEVTVQFPCQHVFLYCFLI